MYTELPDYIFFWDDFLQMQVDLSLKFSVKNQIVAMENESETFLRSESEQTASTCIGHFVCGHSGMDKQREWIVWVAVALRQTLHFFPGVPAPTSVRGNVCSLWISWESLPSTQVLKPVQRLDTGLSRLLETETNMHKHSQATFTRQLFMPNSDFWPMSNFFI